MFSEKCQNSRKKMHEYFQSWYEFFGCTFRIRFCQKWLTLVSLIREKWQIWIFLNSSNISEVVSTLWRSYKNLKTKNFTSVFQENCSTKITLFHFYKPFYVFDWFKLRDVFFSLWGNLLVHSDLRFQATDLHKFGLVGKVLASRWFWAYVWP
jgi:hypothetical protein